VELLGKQGKEKERWLGPGEFLRKGHDTQHQVNRPVETSKKEGARTEGLKFPLKRHQPYLGTDAEKDMKESRKKILGETILPGTSSAVDEDEHYHTATKSEKAKRTELLEQCTGANNIRRDQEREGERY